MDKKKIMFVGALIVLIAVTAGIVTASENAKSDDNYTLEINTTGKWRLDLTVDGKYSSDEGNSAKTIDLGKDVGYASVTVNQYEKAPTNVVLHKGNSTLENKTINGDGSQTIYFYYSA